MKMKDIITPDYSTLKKLTHASIKQVVGKGNFDADFGEEEIALSPEDSIIEDGKVIGFCHGVRVFLIKGGWGYSSGSGPESIGGWGTVSSSSTYTLKKRK